MTIFKIAILYSAVFFDNFLKFTAASARLFSEAAACQKYTQCVKSVHQMRSFFWSVSSCIWTEYGDLRSESPYSIQIQENTDQKKLRIWTLFT